MQFDVGKWNRLNRFDHLSKGELNMKTPVPGTKPEDTLANQARADADRRAEETRRAFERDHPASADSGAKPGISKAAEERNVALQANMSPADRRAIEQREENRKAQMATPDRDGRVIDANADPNKPIAVPVIKHDPNQTIAGEQAPVPGAPQQSKDEAAMYQGSQCTILRSAGQGDRGFDATKGFQVVIRTMAGDELIVLKSETAPMVAPQPPKEK